MIIIKHRLNCTGNNFPMSVISIIINIIELVFRFFRDENRFVCSMAIRHVIHELRAVCTFNIYVFYVIIEIISFTILSKSLSMRCILVLYVFVCVQIFGNRCGITACYCYCRRERCLHVIHVCLSTLSVNQGSQSLPLWV